MSEPSQESLTHRSITAAGWGLAGAGVRIIIQLGAQIVLARLIGPDQYGLYAIGVMVIGFSMFFSDMGIAYGLVQKKEISAVDIRFAFSWQWLLGLAVTLMLALLSAPLADFFNEPRAQSVIAALALVCLLQAAASVSTNLLKRDLRQKTIQFCYAFSYFVGYVLVGIPMALNGYQVWSLVAGWIIQASMSFIILYFIKRHPVMPMFWHDGAKQMSLYGGTVLATNLVNWVISSVDRLVIGRMFPASTVGLYATAYNLMSYSTSTFYAIVQSVFFSAGGQVQGDRARLTRAFGLLMESVALFALPVFACIATVADTFILALYGKEWLAAADMLRPIALAMPFFLVWGLTTPLLWSSGRERKEFIIQLPLAVCWAIASVIAAQYSAVAVAWMVLALSIVRAALFFTVALKHLDRGLAALLAPWWRGGIVAAFACLSAMAADEFLAAFPPLLALAGKMGVGAIAGWGALRWLPGMFSPELVATVGAFSARISPRAVCLIHFVVPRKAQ